MIGSWRVLLVLYLTWQLCLMLNTCHRIQFICCKNESYQKSNFIKWKLIKWKSCLILSHLLMIVILFLCLIGGGFIVIISSWNIWIDDVREVTAIIKFIIQTVCLHLKIRVVYQYTVHRVQRKCFCTLYSSPGNVNLKACLQLFLPHL